ncbi:HPr kinase/phosphorylase [Jannaschia sp. W003]|uniref:HPr kinase/phosphorylase n=1 Tax=Jannaschia sp. W003 TaxID=2867012 RepID=UPI0021A35C7C|nr:hypothetical protein [Jannaschia sp. W003]UWQ21267.1 hypothetical protein K3554_15030 [Jannaschia sp. W003]
MTLPRFHAVDPDTLSVHATAVVVDGAALLLCGPSGSGKSGLAAQMIAGGAGLIADDLCLVRRGVPPVVAAPPDAPAAMELRGLGLVPVPLHPAAPLAAVLVLAPSPARLPEPETIPVLGRDVLLLRHPYRFDAAAKMLIWMAAHRPG